MAERTVHASRSRRSLKRLGRRQAAALSLAGLALLVVTATALAVTGALTQPAGTAGCISNDPIDTGCAGGNGLATPHAVAVSRDGKSVYVGSNSALARLDRNTTTGAISQPAGTAGCIADSGGDATCETDGHGLEGEDGVAVSPNGKSVYVGSVAGSAVVRLNRDTTTGAISEPAGTAGCISGDPTQHCAAGHGLSGGAGSVAVSSDGKSVYAAAGSNDVVRLNRNTTTGAISQPAGTAGCISETGAGPCANGHGLGGPHSVAVSPNGKSVYTASEGGVARFNRNTTTGAISQPAGTAGCISDTGAGPCANGHGLSGPRSVAVSPNGKSVYVASVSGGVARLDRNTTTGAISQPAGTAGCISEDGSGPCADGHGLLGPQSVAVSADGNSVYVASQGTDFTNTAVARFNRNTTTGAISQPAGTPGCISQTGAETCAHGHGLFMGTGVTVSADGKSVYMTSFGSVARFNRAP